MKALARAVAGIERLELPRVTRHFAFNPSVTLHGGRLLACYRGVNYDLRGEGYRPRYCGIPVPASDSQNYLAEINADFTLGRVSFLEDRHIRANACATMGLQDLRLFAWNGSLHAIGSAIGYEQGKPDEPPVKSATMALMRLRGTHLDLLHFLPRRRRREKNWMPWVQGDALHLVYSANPWEVLRLDGQDQPASVMPARTIADMPDMAGSSCVMSCGDRFIAVVHSKWPGALHPQTPDEAGLRYSHRLMVLNADFTIAGIGEEFTFEGERIEYCCGLAIDRGKAILSYGLWDSKAVLVRMDLRALLDLSGLSDLFQPPV